MTNFKLILFSAFLAISVALCLEWVAKSGLKRKARSSGAKGKGSTEKPLRSPAALATPLSPAALATPLSPAALATPLSPAALPILSPKPISPREEGRQNISLQAAAEGTIESRSVASLPSDLETAILGARAALKTASSAFSPALAPVTSPAPALRYDPSEFGDDTLRRLARLLDAFSVGGDWSALLAMGDVYRSGDFPRWLPGDDSAMRIYMACAGCPDGDVAALGAQRYVEARLDRVTAEDRRGAELPTRFAEEGVRRAREVVLAVPYSAWTTPAWRQRGAGSAGGGRRGERTLGRASQTVLGASQTVLGASQTVLGASQTTVLGASQTVLGSFAVGGAPGSTYLDRLRAGRPSSQGMSGILAARPRRQEEGGGGEQGRPGGVAEQGQPGGGGEQGRVNRSDGQNVHDHGISSTLKENAKKILESAGDSLGPEAVAAALEAATDAVLVSDRDEVTKVAALRVLDDLRLPRSAAVHSQIRASAPQVLAAVWNAVEKVAPAGSERRADFGNVLCSQLASAIEKNLPVCLTGKISRILGVLDGHEDVSSALGLQVAMPMWVVRQELGALASKVRDEAEAARGSGAQNGAAESDGGEAEFRRRAFAEYVGKLGMSEKVLAPVVDEYAQGF
jgi:hypothetical protein